MGAPRLNGHETDWDYLSHQLTIRCQGHCEACGEPFVAGRREQNIHHRHTRGMGGTRWADIHGLANLLMLCAGFSRKLGGSSNGCHGLVTHSPHAINAEARGLVVSKFVDPAGVAVVLASGRRVYLDNASPFYLTRADEPLYDLTAVLPAA